ncbi:YopX family protein [Lysinibacillus xylanilyticus]|uniref:YopX family protein n=1 Tax=Lysinibacillus xylanilyticus TaxID=582475 RepID=UPI0037FA0D77
MRENKLRAWDEIGEWMGDVTSIDFDERSIFITTRCSDDENCFELDKTPVMQYTGLKDKNGKDIYEGDVVIREMISGFSINEDFIGEVKMNECRWWIDNGNDAIPLWDEVDELKIIGNIYENLERLGDSK